jgi:hypothetical protein
VARVAAREAEFPRAVYPAIRAALKKFEGFHLGIDVQVTHSGQNHHTRNAMSYDFVA